MIDRLEFSFLNLGTGGAFALWLLLALAALGVRQMLRDATVGPAPKWLIWFVGGLSARVFGWLFRYCFRCDVIAWRRHRHDPTPAHLLAELDRAARDWDGSR